ncbi:hypothetical protein AB395_00001839 [Sinorhizobium fredii CCBAU 45436]|nr:hypothetical protein AB395_00001839 [Sinorhizobium fredii CCBAU 45436]
MKAIVFNVGLAPSVGGVTAGLFLVLPSMLVPLSPLVRDLQSDRFHRSCGVGTFAIVGLLSQLPRYIRFARTHHIGWSDIAT